MQRLVACNQMLPLIMRIYIDEKQKVDVSPQPTVPAQYILICLQLSTQM